MPIRPLLLTLMLAIANLSDVVADARSRAILPPELPWQGASRKLILPARDPWITPAEATAFRRTPTYDETVAWLQKLAKATGDISLVSIGTSEEGREIWMVVASRDRVRTVEAFRQSSKPTVFAQAGIHSGEIDGKDAGLMLLRDMTVRGTKRDLLERANFLFVPIFNVDGHERTSEFNRINQRGPELTGWRTTAKNLNLNRDYAKLDSREMRAMVTALDRWQPDLYLDLHVTDGADYQYDITYGYNGRHAYSPAIAEWLDTRLSPALDRDLAAMGHIPGPLIFGAAGDDLSQGILGWTSDPRFSTGYGHARHLPTILVENHSLKPYEQRVLGTYVLLESVLRTVARDAVALRAAIARDRARRPESVPLTWAPAEAPPPMIDLLGVEARFDLSPVSGSVRPRYTGRKVTIKVPHIRFTRVASQAARPEAYWIHPAWSEVIERLKIHGIEMDRITEPRTVDVTMLRLNDPKFGTAAMEGHVRVSATPVAEQRRERFPRGSVRVPTDQPLAELIVLLLDPSSPDSFFQWGFFNEVLEQIEYVEAYVMEPMAERMLAEDPKLEEEFRQKLAADAEFRGDPAQRLQWFYERTPFIDPRRRLYPVALEVR